VIATVSTLPLAIGLTVVAGMVGPALAGFVGYFAALGVLTSVNFTGQYFYPDDSQKYNAKKLEQKVIEQKKIIEQKRITEENRKIKPFSIQEPSK
jgi:L-lactate permease